MGDWHDEAACRAAVERGDADMSLWFPGRAQATRGSSYDRARAICASCPVRGPCLDEAMHVEQLVDGPREGMFGGLTPPERAALARQRRCGSAVRSPATSTTCAE